MNVVSGNKRQWPKLASNCSNGENLKVLSRAKGRLIKDSYLLRNYLIVCAIFKRAGKITKCEKYI